MNGTSSARSACLGVLLAACASASEMKPPKDPVSEPTIASAEVIPTPDLSAGDAPGLDKPTKASGTPGAKPAARAGKAEDESKSTFTRALVQIDSRVETNHGNVLHMMLRQLDQKAMGVVESYEQAANFVVAPVRDESVLTIQPLIPGKRLTLAVTSDSKKKLVVYFFFTKPGQNWRIELPRPLPTRVSIALGNDQVAALQGGR